jgi:hypothetical protein
MNTSIYASKSICRRSVCPIQPIACEAASVWLDPWMARHVRQGALMELLALHEDGLR